MKSSKNCKVLKASSLLETIVAIVLISICSLVALTVYLNVIGQNNPTAYYKAKHDIELLTDEAALNQNFENDTFSYNNYTIDKNVTFNKNEKLVIIDFTINSGQKTYSIKKLVAIESEN